ncbi:hypothetical protein VTN00DRAFT_6954 [Thermoascus crustaceus]|uniref:uncharacterized protein n=1 Tax=Thermoascus crustaceus TaxID=5088 RepID=UPI0037433FA1
MDSPSINSRRGQRLAPILTDFSKPITRPIIETSRTQRPRPTQDPSQGRDGERVPLQLRPTKRQSSKTSLRNLFSRNKSTRQAKNDHTLPVIEEAQNSARPCQYYASDFPHSPASTTAASTTVSTPTLVASPTSQTPKTRNQKDKPLPPITSWDPPPLFQAYPQSIKHACLLAPTLSADSILRLNASRRGSSAREDAQNNDNDARKKEEKKHSRRMSGSISKTEWTHKIFVLVTSGYILQYAGEGNFDRLPEKMMQLGPTSVAFASDAIPGKHWVLQISQTSDDDGTVPLEAPKTFLSRLGFQTADSRRSARSFLMVLNSPEDMNSWLVAVRRVIEALGGKKYVPETSADEEAARELQNKPSLRNLVKKDPNQFPSPLLEPRRSPFPSIRNKNSAQELRAQVDSSAKSLHRRSMPPRPSLDAPSMSTMPTPTDLDLLREGSRLSHLSGGTRTAASSSGSSPRLSPIIHDTAPSRDASVNPRRSHAAAATLNQNRQSMYVYPSTQADLQVSEVQKSNRPQSAIPETLVRSASPPNFSVPSFSKRFNPVPGPPRTQNSPSDVEQVSQPERPLSPSSRSRYFARSPDAQREPTTPTRENSADFHRTKAYRRLSREYATSTAVSSPHLSPAASITSARTQHSRLKRLSSEIQSPSVSAEDVLANRPQRNSRDEIAYASVHRVPRPQDPDMTDISGSPSHQLHRRVSMQARQGADSPSRGPQSANMYQLRGASSTTLRQEVSGSNSEIVNTATRQDYHHPGTKHISPRKSMPDLSLGPPAAPPPSCPLPEVPPAVVSQFQPAWRGSPGSPNGSMDLSRKSLDGRRARSIRSRAPPDHASPTHRVDNTRPWELDMINAF